MLTFFGFLEIKLCPARNDVFLVPDIMVEDRQQAKLPGRTVRNHHHIDAERSLQVCIFEQQIQYFFRIMALFDLNHRPYPFPVGFVADIVDSRKDLFPVSLTASIFPALRISF